MGKSDSLEHLPDVHGHQGEAERLRQGLGGILVSALHLTKGKVKLKFMPKL